jgi:DNA polymerase-3 subunit epsilon
VSNSIPGLAWWRQPLIAVDLETTGVDPHTDRIVTASVLLVDPLRRTAMKTSEWLVNPGIEIPESATAVHKVSTEHAVRYGVSAEIGVSEITNMIDNLCGYLAYHVQLPDGSMVRLQADARPRQVGIVAYNARFDLTMLHAEMLRCWDEHWSPQAFPIDPMVIDSGMERYRKGKRTLSAVCAKYDVELTEEEAHMSSGDALAACRLAYVMGDMFPAVGGISLDVLLERQRLWVAERDRSYARYRARQAGMSEVEDKGQFAPAQDWPIMADPSATE